MTYGYTYGCGTCNLTSKNKKYISLKSENDEEVDKIISKYNEIIKVINRYPGTKVTFMETPVYSIKNWNESKGHKDPNVFVEQDENLSIRVITKLPNSEQSSKGKVKTHKYINRQNQSTTGKRWKP